MKSSNFIVIKPSWIRRIISEGIDLLRSCGVNLQPKIFLVTFPTLEVIVLI